MRILGCEWNKYGEYVCIAEVISTEITKSREESTEQVFVGYGTKSITVKVC